MEKNLLRILSSTILCFGTYSFAQFPNQTNGFIESITNNYSSSLTIKSSASKETIPPIDVFSQSDMRTSFAQMGTVTITTTDNLHQITMEVNAQGLIITNAIPDPNSQGSWIIYSALKINTINLLNNLKKNIATHNWFISINIDQNGNPSLGSFIISGNATPIAQSILKNYITTESLQQ